MQTLSEKHDNPNFKTLSLNDIQVEVVQTDSSKSVLRFKASDETPVFFGAFWLRPLHGPENIDLEFASSGRAPFCVDHNQETDGVIGGISNVQLDSKQRALYIDVELHEIEKGDQHFKKVQKLKSGKLQNVSIGFVELEHEISEESIDGVPVMDVTKWELVELSAVGVPANRKGAHTVGVSQETEQVTTLNNPPEITPTKETNLMTDKVETEKKVETTKVELSQENQVATERNRTSQLLAIAESTGLSASKAIAEGQSVEDFRQFALDQLVAKSKKDNVVVPAQIDFTEKEEKQYSLSNALNAMYSGNTQNAGFELEVSQELASQMGTRLKSGSILVPTTAFAVSATGAGTGKEFVPTEHRDDMLIEALYNKSVTKGLGVRVIPATADMFIPSGEGVAFSYLGENDAIGEQTPGTGGVTVSPKRAGALVKVSDQHVLQASPSGDRWISQNLVNAASSFVDAMIIAGDGAGSNPTGIMNSTGVAASTVASPAWADLVNMIAEIQTNNLEGNAFLSNPMVDALLKQTAKVAGSDSVMIKQLAAELMGYRHAITNNVPTVAGTPNTSSLVFGDFSEVVLADFGALELSVDREGEDFKRGMMSIRATLYNDVKVLRPNAFSVLNGIEI